MNTVIEKPAHRADNDCRRDTVQVKVNRLAVTLPRGRLTGLEIKQAAIRQKVPIQPDFVLFLVLGRRERRVIGDKDCLKVRNDMCFEAIPHDDNS